MFGSGVLKFEGGLVIHELAHEDDVGSDDRPLDLDLVVGVIHV